MSVVKVESVEQFKELSQDGKVSVDFYAEWCGPCQMLSPVLDELSQEVKDLTILKVDVDNFGDLASEYEVMGVPRLFVLEDGGIKNNVSGFIPKDGLKALL